MQHDKQSEHKSAIIIRPPRRSLRRWVLALVVLSLALVPPAPAQTSTPPAAAPAAKPGKKLDCGALPVVVSHTPFGTIEKCGQAETPAQAVPAPPPSQASAPETKPAEKPAAEAPAPKPGEAAAAPAEPKPGEPAAAAPEQKPEAEKEKKAEAGGTVALNLENADLYQVLRIIGSELKINYIVDPAVKGTVTINTAGNVSRSDLFALLEMILQINGAAAVKTNGYYSIVPLGSAKQMPMPFTYLKPAEGETTPDDAFSLLVAPMKFMSAGEMSKILMPFMSPAGQIVSQEGGNLLLIVDSGTKLSQLREIIQIFDSETLGRQRVRLFPVANNLAKNLIQDLQSVFSGYALSTGKSGIRFVPIERLNAILAISPVPEVFPDVEEWIKKLDQPAREVGIRNFVYKVQNAKASDLRDILIELYGGQVPKAPQISAAAAEQAPPNPMGPNFGAPAAAPAATSPTPASGASPGVMARVQGDIRIMSDDKNNALIVQATPHDYEIIERTLTDLDVLPRQVLIDARIYEVDLTGNLSLGLSAYLDLKSALPGPLTTRGSFVPGQSGGSLQASTFSILSNTKGLQMFLTAEENRGRVRTLSAPSILVTDNTSARIQVGSEVPVPIGSSLTPVQSGGSSLFAQTIQFRDTGVILTVTPRINASGIVNLNVAQEVSSAVPNTVSQIVAPVINKSAFQTSVVLKDGQTLALGGIITTSFSLSRNRVPLIGDIPGVGLLFGQTSRSTTRKELVLMLTPHVIQDIPQGLSMTQDFLERMRIIEKQMHPLTKKP